MEGSCFNCRAWPFLHALHGFLLLIVCIGSFILEPATGTNFANGWSDRAALLDFRRLVIEDPYQVISSWNDSVHFCNWFGVSCSPSNGRVITLNLESQGLVGSVPRSIGNLTRLAGFNLKDNNFLGELPQELGNLRRLQQLNLSYNFFEGKIPTNLSYCKDLILLNISHNQLIGEIPKQLSSLRKLVFLDLRNNNITGNIPPWVGNFSSMFRLSLALNNLQGSIPGELGGLSNLGFLNLYGNFLSGTVPSSMYNLSSLFHYSVAQNKLHGHLPPDIGHTLPSLTVLAGGVNDFTGPIPMSLSNASGLRVIDFAQNHIIGTIPRSLGSLQSILRINFEDNNLGNGEMGDLDFFSSLANCTKLAVLGLAGNQFGGELPSSIGNLSSKLKTLTLGTNLIQGHFPIGIENLVKLNLLGLESNHLKGVVPDFIGKLQNLQGLFLGENGFSGSIPSPLGNLTELTVLSLEKNTLWGSIPPTIGNCKNLQNLSLSFNNLTGIIPKQVFNLSSLSISVDLSHNSLTGSLPIEVGNLVDLVALDLSDNKLSGEIPSTFGSCVVLERVHLEGNSFNGKIPETLAALKSIAELDLSQNHFSGRIPEFLGKFSSLKLLNLSCNDFEGEVTQEGIFANASIISVIGNDKVCGGIPELLLPACPTKRHVKLSILNVIIPSTVAALIFIVLLCAFAVYCMVRISRKNPTSEEWEGIITYSEIMKSTDGFAAENLIGLGSFGSVFKGVLSADGRTVAIKVLNLQQHGATESFIDECNALRSIRHRNLLRVITVCSTIDQQGNDFKCLVFEFMSNGSLDEWLHPRVGEQQRTRRLNLVQRLNMAIDVASALYYLHHDCETAIVHCDLKPSNVLLDEDMTAHVADFGLARFLFETPSNSADNQVRSPGLKGSVGYIPPEYGQGVQVSRAGDIYSFGILLLEMFTGKRPTDVMFKDNLSLHEFVAAALPQHVMGIADPSMLAESEITGDEVNGNVRGEGARRRDHTSQVDQRSKIEECIVTVMKIGLSCSSRSPGERMAMSLVGNTLHRLRETLLRSNNQRRRPRH